MSQGNDSIEIDRLIIHAQGIEEGDALACALGHHLGRTLADLPPHKLVSASSRRFQTPFMDWPAGVAAVDLAPHVAAWIASAIRSSE